MPLVDADSLARMYNHPSKDPVEAVELYREAMKKPENWGSQRVANAITSDQSSEFVRYLALGSSSLGRR